VHEWLAAQLKAFFSRASRSFWKAGTSVLQSTVTILKNDIIVKSAIVELNYKNCGQILFDLPN
jgi:hypothetical protein